MYMPAHSIFLNSSIRELKKQWNQLILVSELPKQRSYNNLVLELLHHDAVFQALNNFTIFILASLACAEFITEPEFTLTITSPSLLLNHFSEWTTPTHLFECLSPLLLPGCNKTKSKAIHICLWHKNTIKLLCILLYISDCTKLHSMIFQAYSFDICFFRSYHWYVHKEQ